MTGNTKAASRRKAARQEERTRRASELRKRVEAERIILCVGCHLIGWYPAGTSLDRVVSDLERWASDPAYWQSLPWPLNSMSQVDGTFEWLPGEDLALWYSGRLRAVIARSGDGTTLRLTRFDNP